MALREFFIFHVSHASPLFRACLLEEHPRRAFLPLFRHEKPRVRHCPGTFVATCRYYRVIRGAKRLFPAVWRTFRCWNPASASFRFSLPGGCAFSHPPVFHSSSVVAVLLPRRVKGQTRSSPVLPRIRNAFNFVVLSLCI